MLSLRGSSSSTVLVKFTFLVPFNITGHFTNCEPKHETLTKSNVWLYGVNMTYCEIWDQWKEFPHATYVVNILLNDFCLFVCFFKRQAVAAHLKWILNRFVHVHTFTHCLFALRFIHLHKPEAGSHRCWCVNLQKQGCFSGCSGLRDADNITKLASLHNTGSVEAYLHQLYLLPSWFWDINATLHQWLMRHPWKKKKRADFFVSLHQFTPHM